MNESDGLKKYLTPLAVWALSFGNAVGWGAFVMPGTSFLPVAGPVGTFLGMATGALIMCLFAFNYSYLMGIYPDAGGAFIYTTRIFGYDHGFLNAWFLCLTYVAILWANMTALGLVVRNIYSNALNIGYMYTIAGYDIYLGEVVAELLLLFTVTVFCIYGKRFSAKMQIIFAMILFAGICIITFMTVSDPSAISCITPPFAGDNSIPAQILSITIMAPWAFIGFESVSHSVEEAGFPVKKFKGIMLVSILTALISYVSLNFAAASSCPGEFSGRYNYLSAIPELKGIKSFPLFYIVENAGGKRGLVFLSAVILCGIITGMTATMVASGRLIFSMAREKVIPNAFAKLTGDGSPKNAIIFVGAVSAIIPFLGRSAISWVVDITTIGAIMIYAYVSAAVFRKAKENGDKRTGYYGLAGLVISVFLGLFALVPNIWSISALAAESYLVLAIWGILGIICFHIVFRNQKVKRMGQVSLVWIALLFLIFFSSTMWMRRVTHEKTEEILGEVSTYYSNEMVLRGASRSEGDTVREKRYLEEEMTDIRNTLFEGSLIQIMLIMTGLIVILATYEVMRKKELKMEQDKNFAEENSRAKSNFLSNMSHDIRTPMNAIIGYVDLSKDEDITLDRMKDYMDKIDRSSRHLLALINDILEMSRIESGKLELEESDIDIVSVMDEIRDMFEVRMKEKGIEYTVDTDGVLHRYVKCDKVRFSRILLNLISNAYKFSDKEDGKVDVTLVETGYDNENGIVSFKLNVKDNGLGMSEEFSRHIFDAFERERTSTVSGIEGTGLGMAITRNIVRMMNGDIRVITSSGQGSEFIIDLSFREGDPGKAENKENENGNSKDAGINKAKSVDFSGKRVLLADDMQINREIAVMILKKMNFEIVTAENGQKALDLINENEGGYFDLIITDIQMPVMDGYELTRKVRELKDDKKKDVPIIAMTANAFSEDARRAIESGMNGHVAKPIDIGNLIETLTKVLK